MEWHEGVCKDNRDARFNIRTNQTGYMKLDFILLDDTDD